MNAKKIKHIFGPLVLGASLWAFSTPFMFNDFAHAASPQQEQFEAAKKQHQQRQDWLESLKKRRDKTRTQQRERFDRFGKNIAPDLKERLERLSSQRKNTEDILSSITTEQLAAFLSSKADTFHTNLEKRQTTTVQGEVYPYSNIDLETVCTTFIKEMESVQENGDFDQLSRAFYRYVGQYSEILELDLPEEAKKFRVSTDILENNITDFCVSKGIAPPNLLSPERLDYELKQAYARQLPEDTIPARRALIEQYKGHFEAFAKDDVKSLMPHFGPETDLGAIKAPSLKDINRWPPEQITELSDEQIQSIKQTALKNMTIIIDEEFNLFLKTKNYADALNRETISNDDTPSRIQRYDMPNAFKGAPKTYILIQGPQELSI